jgi:flagellin-like hook-associated protein FlgL
MNIGSSYYTTALTRQFSLLQNAQAKAQGMMATGKKFVEASDNPNLALETQRISLNRLDLDGDTQRRNLANRLNEAARLNAGQARDVLKSAANEIALAFEGGPDSAENVNIGQNVDIYIEQAVAFLNYELDGRYLFGGNASFGGPNEPERPFELIDSDDDGSYDDVVYNGSDQSMEFDVGLDVRMDPTADAKLNIEWRTWMKSIIDAKLSFEAGDLTASKADLDDAGVAEQSAFASNTDLIGKSLRIQTIEDWAVQADQNFANREAAIQEADLNEVVLQFNELQRNYQASLQSGRMLLSLSLIDFI